MKFKNIFKYLVCVFIISISSTAKADVTCTGTIKEIVKWSGSEDISILLSNTGRYIKFTDNTSKSLLLAAYAAKKTVTINMGQDHITSCDEGWGHYTVHSSGYFKIAD